jgi:hypothetical protein
VIKQFELTETFEAEAGQLFLIFGDAERWPADSIARVLVVRAPGFIQVAFLDQSRAGIQVTSTGNNTCEVVISHELLASAEAAKLQKKFWQGYLKLIRQKVER